MLQLFTQVKSCIHDIKWYSHLALPPVRQGPVSLSVTKCVYLLWIKTNSASNPQCLQLRKSYVWVLLSEAWQNNSNRNGPSRLLPGLANTVAAVRPTGSAQKCSSIFLRCSSSVHHQNQSLILLVLLILRHLCHLSLSWLLARFLPRRLLSPGRILGQDRRISDSVCTCFSPVESSRFFGQHKDLLHGRAAD